MPEHPDAIARRRTHASLISTAVAAAAAIALTGCTGGPASRLDLRRYPASSSSSSAGHAQRPAPAKESLGAPAGDAESDLARRAMRDVEAVLEMQQLEPAGAPAPLAAPAAPDWRATGSAPVIQWLDSASGSASAPGAGRETPALVPAPAGQSGANPGAAFEPGPLFRPEEPLRAEPAPSPGESLDLEHDRVTELMVALSGELYRSSTDAAVPLRELLPIAALSIARPQRALEANAMLGLSPAEREVLASFQSFCRQVGEQLDGSRAPAEVLAEALAALRGELVEEPQLTIGAHALCYHVGGFGDYQPFDRYAFLAHEQQRLILYLEVDEFTSELNERGEWVTELSQQLVIYSDRDGIPVWTDDWQPAVDVSRKQRQDFFTVQVITLPRALSVGRYQLKVRLRDEKSGAEAETSIELEMVADPKLAARVP